VGYSTISDVQAITGAEYIDTAYILESVSGTFVAGETITGAGGQTSTVTVVGPGYIEATPDNSVIEIDAEAITGGTSGATATVTRVKSPTKPTRAQVTGFIADVYGDINYALSLQAIETPVTSGADLLKKLLNIERLGVAVKCDDLNYVQSADNSSRRSSEWAKSYKKGMLEIEQHPELFGKSSRLDYDFPASTTYVTAKNQIL
jgi:hypothetical protein